MPLLALWRRQADGSMRRVLVPLTAETNAEAKRCRGHDCAAVCGPTCPVRLGLELRCSQAKSGVEPFPWLCAPCKPAHAARLQEHCRRHQQLLAQNSRLAAQRDPHASAGGEHASSSESVSSAVPLDREGGNGASPAVSVESASLTHRSATSHADDGSTLLGRADRYHSGVHAPSLADLPLVVREMISVQPNRLVVAGGCVVRCVLDPATLPPDAFAHSDIDVFVLGIGDKHHRRAFRHACRYLFHAADNVAAGPRGPSVVTFSIPGLERNVQLIYSNAGSPSELLESFDLDVVRAYFHLPSQGAQLQVHATEAAWRTWHTRHMDVSADVTLARLARWHRRGFACSPARSCVDPVLLHAPLPPTSFVHGASDSHDFIVQGMTTHLLVDRVYFGTSALTNRFPFQFVGRNGY